MPLLISGRHVNALLPDSTQFVSSYPELLESSVKLRDVPSKQVGPNGLLYVCQKEYAVVPVSADNITVLGTDDSTTCHVLVIKHSGSGVASIAHLDGCKTKKCIHKMFAKLKQLSLGSPDGRFEAHLAGGFLDSRHISAKLSLQILNALMAIPDEIHLLTACITGLNDTVIGSAHYPIIYGLAYELKTGLLYPATFLDRGPDVDIRSASHFKEDCEPADIFENDQMVVGPFDWNVSTRTIQHYLSQSDDYFRKNWSTSPEQEPAHFVDHIRQALYVLRDHPDPRRTLFANERPRLYRKQSDGLWHADQV